MFSFIQTLSDKVILKKLPQALPRVIVTNDSTWKEADLAVRAAKMAQTFETCCLTLRRDTYLSPGAKSRLTSELLQHQFEFIFCPSSFSIMQSTCSLSLPHSSSCLSVSFVSIKDSILLDLIEWLSLYRIPTTDRASTITPIAQNKNHKNLKACKGALEKRRVLAGFARKLKKARKTRLDSLAIPVM